MLTKEDIAAIQQIVAPICAGMNQLHEDMSEMRRELNEVKAEQKQMRIELNELREDVNELRKDVDVLRKDVDILRKDVDCLRKDVDQLCQDVKVLKEEQQWMREKVLHVEALIEIEICPHMNIIIENYEPAARSFRVTVEKVEAMEKDIEQIKSVVIEHSAKLNTVA